MNKYFAKYLPVEGGVFFTNALNSEGVIGQEGLQDVFFQKKKLFLCSRDWEYGDNVIHIKTFKKTTISPAFINKYLHKMGYNDDENWVKVIGEISPNATWVKEGDEFTEEQLGIYTDDTLSSMVEFVPYNCIPEDNWNDLGSPDIIIGILCPTCKTFH